MIKRNFLLALLVLVTAISGSFALSGARASAVEGTCPDGRKVYVDDEQDLNSVCAAGSSCNLDKSGVLGLPTWYKYLPGKTDATGACIPQLDCARASTTCYTQDGFHIDPANLWLIVLAVIEILLRLAGIVAVGIVMFGGFKYITSQGNPDATKSARNTIINAFVGLTITIFAAVIVNFVANLLDKK